MSWGPFLDRFWRRPSMREGQNEQKKAAAALVNALAVTAIAAGLIGPAITPALAGTLMLWHRLLLVAGAILAHICVRAILWSLEDR
ncbi:MAG: hypothetical protein ABL883_03625 [Terricaulis sp.]